MSKHILSKSTFIRSQQCQKSLYLNKKRPFLRDRLSAEQLAKFKRGTDVGELAQSLFPGGMDMRPKSPSQFQLKRDETALAIENSEINVLYEAVFQYDDVLIMLDVLVRDGNMWKAYEVKSSKAISDTYLKDAALQYYVLKGCNVLLSDFSLIYMNKDYILEDSLVLEDLFITQSVINHVDKQIDIIEKQIQIAKQTLELTSSPEIAIGNQCNYPYPCDFKGHCWKNVPEKSVLNLTTFDTDSLFELYHSGIQLIEQFPIDLIQITNQQYEIEAFNKNTLVFDKEALENYLESYDITEITFLKVLFKQAAVPVIPKIKPYQLIPIAISFLKNNETESTTIVFSEAESGIKNFINLINDLILNSTIITEDADLLINCIDGLSDNFAAQNKILGLSELVEDGMIYHPVLSADYSLMSLLAITSKMKITLTNEIYLQADITQNTDNDKHNTSLNKLSHYSRAIQSVFDYFSNL